MIQNYVIIFFGSLLGMFLTILVQSEVINRSQKFESGFKQAFKFYTTQQRGGIYIGLLVVAIAMFILPNITASSNKTLLSVVKNLRGWSILAGIGSQAIGFLLVRSTHKKLLEIEQKIDNTKNDTP